MQVHRSRSILKNPKSILPQPSNKLYKQNTVKLNCHEIIMQVTKRQNQRNRSGAPKAIRGNKKRMKRKGEKKHRTLAGQAGKPLTLASTRSPKLKLLSLALLPPFLRPPAMKGDQ